MSILDWLSRLTPEEKADLYKGIGYDKNANIAKLPKEVSVRLNDYMKPLIDIRV